MKKKRVEAGYKFSGLTTNSDLSERAVNLVMGELPSLETSLKNKSKNGVNNNRLMSNQPV